MSKFDDNIFCVHLQRQYSAARELDGFLSTFQGDMSAEETTSSSKYKKALQRGRDNENKLNDQYLKKKQTNHVFFGDIIQLFHVKSMKYLKIIPDKLATDERENLKIVLDPNGDIYSWLQVSPRFKIDREGDRINSNNEILLKVVERPGEMVHCSDRKPVSGKPREVNCSLEFTSWRMVIFQTTLDSIESSLLLASQIIKIYDPETRAMLALADVKKGTDIDDMDKKVNEDAIQGMNHEYGNIIAKPVSDDKVDSSTLWLVETKKLVVGGAIQWKVDQVRLRHLNTKLYLLQETLEIFNAAEGYMEEKIIYTTTPSPGPAGTLFSIAELNSTNNLLNNGKPVQIHQNGIWLERGEVQLDMTYVIKGTKDRSKTTSLLVQRHTQDNGGDGADDDVAADDEDSGPKLAAEPMDVFVGVVAKEYLLKYYSITKFEPGFHGHQLWPSIEPSEFELFFENIEKLVNFSHGFSISATNVNLEIDKSDPNLRLQRQNLLREQGILEVLLKIINKFVVVSEKQEKIAGTNTILPVIDMGAQIITACFRLVYSTLEGNRGNEMYIADYLPVLLAHLACQPLAGKCVTSMLSNNVELQETKIGDREVNIFVNKLRSSKMNYMYMELLQACCSCQDGGVDGNQCRVANTLFSTDEDEDAVKESSVLIHLHADFNNCNNNIDWDPTTLYMPPIDSVEKYEVMGDKLIKNGLPKLSVSWDMPASREMSSQNLYNTDKVHIQEFCNQVVFLEKKSVKKKSKKGKTKSEITAEYKQIVLDYFITELFLAAEMCMDRNYVAMHKLDALFPFDVLLAMVKSDISPQLKSAAVRLLLCLHVDRDPQAGTRIPCLTRTWSSIAKNETPQLPYVEPERQYVFGIIQVLLSEHVNEMAGRKWHELSRHMLKMLRTLISFNFYGTNDRIRDVIYPLVQALDRRAVIYSDVAEVCEVPSEDNNWVDQSLGSKDGLSVTLLEDGSQTIDGEEKEEVVVIPKKSWQERLLKILESFRTLVLILVLVVVAVAATIYQTMENIPDGPGTPMRFFELCVLAVFVLEMTFRAYCHWFVKGSLEKFYKNYYNWVDFIVIIIDVAFLLLPADLAEGSSAQFSKILRLVRMVRLVRICRAARLVSSIREDLSDIKREKWKAPIRYSKAPIFEVVTMVDAVDVLLFTQSVIDDRNLSLLLRQFYLWQKEEISLTPSEIFEEVVEASQELSLGVEGFDMIFLDLLMFQYSKLVQSSLDAIMAHHTMRRTLLDNAEKIQLMISFKREKEYKLVDSMLKQLEANAETHELWGELETDEDHEKNKQTKDIMNELIGLCRNRRYILEINEDYEADTDTQDLFRNLGCFEICLKVLGLLDSVDPEEDGSFCDVALNTRDLILICNSLLYWFFMGNQENQDMGYDELQFFLDSLDKKINSHLVLKSLFFGNEKLMKIIPHYHLQALSDRIVQEGKSSYLLTLFASITNVGDNNITENQFEIMRCLTSPGRLEKVGFGFVPTDHPEYEEKVSLMEPFLDKIDLDTEELPTLMAYHLTFIEVMANCTVGRSNITSVEAKVQTVYNFSDIVNAILDPRSLLLLKIRLSVFFFNAIIEVEMRIPGLEYTGCVWRLIKSFVDVMAYAKDELRLVEKLGWESSQVSRQKIEYIVACVMVVSGFFNKYYNPLSFRLDDSVQTNDRIDLTMNEINETIVTLFHSIKDVYDIDSPRLSQTHKGYFYNAIVALNNSTPKVIVTRIDQTHLPKEGNNTDIEENISQEAVVTRKYKEFIAFLKEDEEIQDSAKNENSHFISVLEGLPFISDPCVSDIRYEALIKKFVAHIRENMSVIDNEKYMESRCQKTTAWIIRAFRQMIENAMEMSIYDRDEDGGEEEDEKAAPVIAAFNAAGATTLVLDLINVGIDDELQFEAIELGVALLYKEGGAVEVQEIMHKYLTTSPNTDIFFRQCRNTIIKLSDWHKWQGITCLPEGEDPDLPKEILLIRFLQLMSEGHYNPNQDLMREQPMNDESINLLDDIINFQNILSRTPCRTSTTAGLANMALILEVIQGPCFGNSNHFALNTELLETLNRLMRARSQEDSDCDSGDEVELKKTAVDIFQGLLEGQGAKSVVYERLLSVLHMDTIQVYAMPEDPVVLQVNPDDVEAEGEKNEEIEESEPVEEEEEEEDEEVILRAECMVLLQMLSAFKPSLRTELDLPDDVSDTVACVEVMWRGVLQRRFFHVPEICGLLAKSSKDALVEEVDRSNLENKLLDFLSRSHNLYREVKHQEKLNELGISFIFSPFNKDKATWAAFFLSIFINMLFVTYYTRDDMVGEPSIPDDIRDITYILNLIQICISSFVLILSLVVSTPVVYKTLESGRDGYHGIWLVIWTALDPMTVYYIWYLLTSIMGAKINDYYLPLLLLDIIVKNSTTKNVLNAVVLPRKALSMALILGLFIIYIYSYYYFFFFREDSNNFVDDSCMTLMGCFKLILVYGMINGGGIGDSLDHDIGFRSVLDLSFFLLVTIVLLNVIFGIIIDTFGELRNLKDERIINTTQLCFICGISKQVFDRASDGPDGFKNHIRNDHNMWNYLCFILYLWEQDKDDDDGLEQFVRRCVEKEDISWFPQNKAMQLTASAGGSEILKAELMTAISDKTHHLSHKLTDLRSEIGVLLSTIRSSLLEDHGEGSSVKGSLKRNLSKLHSNDNEEFDLYEDIIFDDEKSLVKSKDAFIEITSIKGHGLSTELLKTIIVKIYTDSSHYDIHSHDIQDGVIHFESDVCEVAEDVNINNGDSRKFSIHLVAGNRKLLVHDMEVMLILRNFDRGIEDVSIPFIVDGICCELYFSAFLDDPAPALDSVGLIKNEQSGYVSDEF
jgi:hypothetical protein